jgi:lambda family phage minor tail protein L
MNIYELSGDKHIHLFKLSSKNAANETLYFCGFEGVIYQNIPYEAIPCEISGYNSSTSGVISPSITVFGKLISPLIRAYNHLLGWEISVLRIRKAHLNLSNPLAQRPFDIFTVTQKTSEVPGKLVSFKLKPRTNLKGQLGRQLNANCNYVYRSHGCEYQGGAMFTANNEITHNSLEDVCALTLTACKLRNNLENFGGIPTINDFG